MNRFDDRELEAVASVIKSGKLSRFFQNFRGGEQVQAFENEFAEYLNIKHAISVSNGTVSLEIALKSLGIGKGDEVITTPFSFVATATAILRVGAHPRFVDINPETLNINASQIENAVCRKTKAIMPVSLCGFPVEMDQIMKIARKHNLYVIEDAAQALGAEFADKKIGTWGDFGSFSFQETKSITSLGEGGMIVTNNDVLAEKCRHLRNHGNCYGMIQMDEPCTNARLSEAQAAFGRVQLQKLSVFNKTQIENAEYFLSHLPAPLKPVYVSPSNGKPIYLLIPAILSDAEQTRDAFLKYLAEQKVSHGIPGQNVGYYKSLIYEYPLFVEYARPCVNALWARKNVVVFDIHRWDKTIENMKNYLEMIRRFFET